MCVWMCTRMCVNVCIRVHNCIYTQVVHVPSPYSVRCVCSVKVHWYCLMEHCHFPEDCSCSSSKTCRGRLRRKQEDLRYQKRDRNWKTPAAIRISIKQVSLAAIT